MDRRITRTVAVAAIAMASLGLAGRALADDGQQTYRLTEDVPTMTGSLCITPDRLACESATPMPAGTVVKSTGEQHTDSNAYPYFVIRLDDASSPDVYLFGSDAALVLGDPIPDVDPSTDDTQADPSAAPTVEPSAAVENPEAVSPTLTLVEPEVVGGTSFDLLGDGFEAEIALYASVVDSGGNPMSDPTFITTDVTGSFTDSVYAGNEPGVFSVEITDEDGTTLATAAVAVAGPLVTSGSGGGSAGRLQGESDSHGSPWKAAFPAVLGGVLVMPAAWVAARRQEVQ